MGHPDFVDFTHDRLATDEELQAWQDLAGAGLPEGYVTVGETGVPTPDLEDPATMLKWMQSQNGGKE